MYNVRRLALTQQRTLLLWQRSRLSDWVPLGSPDPHETKVTAHRGWRLAKVFVLLRGSAVKQVLQNQCV
jgi:hypothetical protein